MGAVAAEHLGERYARSAMHIGLLFLMLTGGIGAHAMVEDVGAA